MNGLTFTFKKWSAVVGQWPKAILLLLVEQPPLLSGKTFYTSHKYWWANVVALNKLMYPTMAWILSKTRPNNEEFDI
jgi:hypothetical protein